MSTTTLYPVADSFVDDGTPTTNYGTNSNVYVGLTYGEGYGITRGWLKFDVSSLSGATINSATLHASAYKAGVVVQYDTVLIRLEYCTDNSWTNSGITWNNAPNGSVSGSPITLVTLTDTEGTTVSATVTSDVSTAVAAGNYLSWRIKSNVETKSAYVKMYSSNHGSQIYLDVDYTPPSSVTGYYLGFE